MLSHAATQGWLDATVTDHAERDADTLATKAAADEAAAAAARDEYRARGLPGVSADSPPIELAPEELIHVHRPHVALQHSSASGVTSEVSSGPMWVTSHRLAHVGERVTNALLRDIEEMSVALGQLLLIRMRDGSGMAIETDSPRLLRVQLAAAIEASRRG